MEDLKSFEKIKKEGIVFKEKETWEKLYIFVGATTFLNEERIYSATGFALKHLEKTNKNFKTAMKKVKKEKIPTKTVGAQVEGDSKSNYDDILERVYSRFRGWQPSLKDFNFNENHFNYQGLWEQKNRGLFFKFVVIFHFA